MGRIRAGRGRPGGALRGATGVQTVTHPGDAGRATAERAVCDALERVRELLAQAHGTTSDPILAKRLDRMRRALPSICERARIVADHYAGRPEATAAMFPGWDD